MLKEDVTQLKELRGVVPPMITPFGEDDRIDFGLLEQETQFLDRCGVDGIVVAGSTGEGAGMSPAEVAECVRVAAGAVAGRIPVLAAVIADSSTEAIRLAKAARLAGAAGLQVPPPSYRTSIDYNVLASYYRAITDASGLPLIIYNVIPWAQVAREALSQMTDENPLIIGVKQSGRNFRALMDLLANRIPGVAIFSAIDDMIFPSFMLGVDGTISGTSSIFPRETIALKRAVETGDLAHARELHRALAATWRVCDKPDFPTRIKYTLKLLGRSAGRPRRPFGWPAQPLEDEVRRTLVHYDLLHGSSAALDGKAAVLTD